MNKISLGFERNDLERLIIILGTIINDRARFDQIPVSVREHYDQDTAHLQNLQDRFKTASLRSRSDREILDECREHIIRNESIDKPSVPPPKDLLEEILRRFEARIPCEDDEEE